MMTHTLTIDGKQYTLRLTGTIGIQILAQSFVPNEEDRYTIPANSTDGEKQPTGKWLMALLYACFFTSNEAAAEKIDFLHFIASFSTKEFHDAVTWYYKAYAEREGLLPAGDSSSGEEDSDPKND